jgi:hypothetical protein
MAEFLNPKNLPLKCCDLGDEQQINHNLVIADCCIKKKIRTGRVK